MGAGTIVAVTDRVVVVVCRGAIVTVTGLVVVIMGPRVAVSDEVHAVRVVVGAGADHCARSAGFLRPRGA